jgi:hypothetical protein
VAKIKKRTKADISALTSNQVKMQKVGKSIIFSVVDPPRPSDSERKKETNGRFKLASRWAKKTLLKTGMMELYSKGITEQKNCARIVAVTDYMTAPKIHYVNAADYKGVVGDPLRIKATDDFGVVAVNVSISNAAGKLEEGAAVRYRRKPTMWVYIATVTNPELTGTIITVTAEDRPGNQVLGELVIGNEGDKQIPLARTEVIFAEDRDVPEGERIW